MRYITVTLVYCLFSCITFGQELSADRVKLGRVKDSRMSELSGLIISHKYENKFWTHNDSGDSARIFLIDKKANLKAIFSLEGIEAKDIEDIASFRYDGKSFLIVADIGDNRGLRQSIQLYIFEEPDYVDGKLNNLILREDIRVLNLRYEDKPRDAEAIFVDPTDLSCYLISKRELMVGVYAFNIIDVKDKDSIRLTRSLTLPITYVTSADISKKGNFVLVKNLTQVFLWQRLPGQTVLDMLREPYRLLNYEAEPQGEAISFDSDEAVFYTISERALGLDSYLYQYTIDSLYNP